MAAQKQVEKRQERERWKAYERQARELTEQHPLHQLPGYHLRGAGGYALDHRVSIYKAFRAGWPVEQAAALDNLQLVPIGENLRKGTGCYSSLEARHLPMAA